jgi:hypothetical protein
MQGKVRPADGGWTDGRFRVDAAHGTIPRTGGAEYGVPAKGDDARTALGGGPVDRARRGSRTPLGAALRRAGSGPEGLRPAPERPEGGRGVLRADPLIGPSRFGGQFLHSPHHVVPTSRGPVRPAVRGPASHAHVAGIHHDPDRNDLLIEVNVECSGVSFGSAPVT